MNSIYDKYFVEQNCPVCGSNERKLQHKNILHTCFVLEKAKIDVKNEEAMSDIVKCLHCHHSYLSRIIKEEYINKYYSEANSEYYDAVKQNPYDRRPLDTKRFGDLILEKCPSAKNVLEIGSGLGHLLNDLSLKGLDCYGVEPSPLASEFSRKTFNLNVVTSMLNEKTFENKKFDIILIMDVVEHVANINELMKLVKHYLAKNGRLVVLTGNNNSLYAKLCGKKWLYYFSWEHISFFNKSSTKFLFNKHALQLEHFIKTQHSGTFYENMRMVFYTIFCMCRNFFGVRKQVYYYMAFDHFFAIGKNDD
ncbi:class I SAM-dependent methyltransferase [Ferruginibacter yonginensis]|uniref:Class I SAM-dependent methyltransferase n=1 Tax=Ferruginibacter yonginensis TaxID=1310416 RepID=A0ABV8QUI1_9BACT